MGLEVAGWEDLYRKLHGTICLYKGIPVSVTAEDDRRRALEVRLSPIDNKADMATATVKCTSDDLEVYDIPMGYFFHRSGCFYLTRATRRLYNQGIHANNIAKTPGFSNALLYTPEFANCVLGKHIPCERAFEMVAEEDYQKVPFHRHFAFSSDGEGVFLLYKDKQIAYNMSGEIGTFQMYGTSDVSIILREVNKNGFGKLFG